MYPIATQIILRHIYIVIIFCLVYLIKNSRNLSKRTKVLYALPIPVVLLFYYVDMHAYLPTEWIQYLVSHDGIPFTLVGIEWLIFIMMVTIIWIEFDSKYNKNKLAIAIAIICLGGTIPYTGFLYQMRPNDYKLETQSRQWFDYQVTTQDTVDSEITLYTNTQNVTLSLRNDDKNFMDVSTITTLNDLHKVKDSTTAKLTKGSVSKIVDTDVKPELIDTSNIVKELNNDDLFLVHIKITKVTLVSDTHIEKMVINPDVYRRNDKRQYFKIEYTVTNKDDLDTMIQQRNQDKESIDRVLHGDQQNSNRKE